jgi:hypothetical protein
MQLVMKRSRLYSGIWFRFKINARLVLEETEKRLLVKYTLKDVPLTDRRTRRDLIRAALIIIPIAVIFAVVIAFIVAVLRVIAFGLPIVVFISILVVIYIYTFMQIREVVFVNDLLVGRDFKARSLLALLHKEHQLREMSKAFQNILEQAETWHIPEVIDLTLEPILSVLEDENAVA